MIIELYGLPGSGKTTFARKIVQYPGFTRVVLVTKKEILWYFFLGVVCRPVTFFYGAFLCVKYNATPFHIWNSYCTRYAKYQKACMCQEEYVILDEGPLQCLLALLQNELPEKVVSSHLIMLPQVGLTIVYDIGQRKRSLYLSARARQKVRDVSHTDPVREAVVVANDVHIKKLFKNRKTAFFVGDETSDDEILRAIKGIKV